MLVPLSTNCTARNQKGLPRLTMQHCFLARLLQQAIGPSTTWFCLVPFQDHANSHVQFSTKISGFYGQCSRGSISNLLNLITPWAPGSCHFPPGQVFLTDLSISLSQFPFTAVKNETLTELASASLNRCWWELSLLCQTAPAHILNLYFCLSPSLYSSHTFYFLFLPLQFMYLEHQYISPFLSLCWINVHTVSVNPCGSECTFLVLSHCLGLQISYPWLGLITTITWRSTNNQLPPQSIKNPLHFL